MKQTLVVSITKDIEVVYNGSLLTLQDIHSTHYGPFNAQVLLKLYCIYFYNDNL